MCQNAIDLTELKPPYEYAGEKSLDTLPDDLRFTCGGAGGEQIFMWTVPIGMELKIRQTRWQEENVHQVQVGRQCPGERVLNCSDKEGEIETFINTYTMELNIYYIITKPNIDVDLLPISIDWILSSFCSFLPKWRFFCLNFQVYFEH